MNKLNNIHEKCLRLMKNDCESTFKLTIRIMPWTLNLKNLHPLPHDRSLYNYSHAISWTNCWHFYSSEKSLNICSICLLDSDNLWSMRFGVNAMDKDVIIWMKVINKSRTELKRMFSKQNSSLQSLKTKISWKIPYLKSSWLF